MRFMTLLLPLIVLLSTSGATADVGALAGSTWAQDRDAGNGNVVVIGDSISAGAPFCAWPNCWVDRTSWEWPTTNLARHGAMPGDLIPDGWCDRACWYADWGVNVMAQVVHVQPSVVIVALGAVPYGFIGQHPLDYAASMRALVASIRELSPRSTVMLVHTPGFVASHGLYWVFVDYGRALAQIADDTPNVDYVDLARDMPWSNSDTSGAFTADRVHPNDAGHVMMAIAVIGALRRAR